MGSIGSPPSVWAPYDSYKDCSKVICSIYCPQWCYIIFPPPPPEADDSSGTPFSPLIIAVIGILVSAFLIVSYYTIVTRYCRRRGSTNGNVEFEARHDEVHHDQWQVAAAGLDESMIKSITVFKYKKSDKLVEGTECAVCLNEFQEQESLRLLPKCCHAFHLPCIDTWLKSQSSCPLCRANVNPITPVLPPPAPNPRASATLNVSALETQRQNDLAFVVEDQEREVSVSLGHVCDIDSLPKDDHPFEVNIEWEISEERNIRIDDDDEQQVVQPFRRSVSLNTYSRQNNLLVADILRIDEHNNAVRDPEGISVPQSGIEIGPSEGIQEGSFSGGRFINVPTRDHDKGKNHMLPS